jgi:hypothetical protein
MNERELREAKERRSAGLAFRRGQEEMEGSEAGKRRADARVDVVEVNEFGQPKLALTLDRETNARGEMEFVEGYRTKAGVTHEYSPMDALTRKGYGGAG